MHTQPTPIAFSGDIPMYYDSYLGPMFFEPFALDMANRISKFKPKDVLELASGTGRLTKLLPAVTSKDSEIVASDINPAMVKYGQSKVDGNNVRWMVADAVTLPFGDAEFDCIVVQFGVMFYSDRINAFKEAWRVLKPGGTFIFSCWDEIKFNPMPMITNEVLTLYFPVNTPAFYSVPFSYYDKGLIKENLNEAGFWNVNIETVNLNGYSTSASNAAKGLINGTPTVTAIEDRDPEKLPLVLETLDDKISTRFGPESLRVPLQAHVVTCVK